MSRSRIFRRLSLLVLSLILYTVIGGVIFFYIENCVNKENTVTPTTQHNFKRVVSFCKELLKPKRSDIFLNFSSGYSMESNETLARCIKSALNFTYHMESSSNHIKNCSFNIKNFMPWATFATRVIFTIGPGKYYPRTTLGQAILILYSILGIPSGMLMLYYASRFFSGLTFSIIASFELHIFDHNRVHNVEKKVVALSLFFVLGWILGISFMNSSKHFEGVPYFEAVTHWFMLITTLGVHDDAGSYWGSNDWGWKDIIANISLAIGLSLTASFILSSVVLACTMQGYTKTHHGINNNEANDQIEANPVCFIETGY